MNCPTKYQKGKPQNDYTMNTFFKTIWVAVLLVSLIAVSRLYGNLPPAPNPPVLVNDFSALLTPSQAASLESRLAQYARTHGTQIAIVTINDLGGMPAAEFADRLAEKWGIGMEGNENGVLVLVNPAEGAQRGNVHISIGYGLEGVIPDITAKRIVDNELLPNFRGGNFYQGLDMATGVLMSLAAGEFSASDYTAKTETQNPSQLLVLLFFFAMIGLSLFRGRRAHHSMGRNIPFWTWMLLMSQTQQRSRGAWGNFSGGTGAYRGGFGGGSFGGGGFGGFGGGSFGGGGAGGSW